MIPALHQLPAAPRRIILHWTGGGPRANAIDREHYHFIVEQDGRVVAGVPVEANLRVVGGRAPYAAHTRGMNSYSVAVSFAGMLEARQGRQFGPHPLTRDQVMAGLRFVAACCRAWKLDPSDPAHLFTHDEAERVHGVRQAQKWDITELKFLPGIPPAAVGPWLREQAGEALLESYGTPKLQLEPLGAGVNALPTRPPHLEPIAVPDPPLLQWAPPAPAPGGLRRFLPRLPRLSLPAWRHPMEIVRSFLSRIVGVFIGLVVAWLATVGIELGTEFAQAAEVTIVLLLMGLMQLVYAFVHRLIDRRIDR